MTPRGGSRVTTAQIAAYSVASFAAMFLIQPVTNFIPQLYAKELGLSLAGLGTVIFVGRFVDAVSDQVLGYLSDRTRSRWGARKPWIAGGSTLMLIAAFFLMRPPPAIGLVYFFVWRLVYDMSSTMLTLNYSAWGAELSDDYHTRSRIVAFRGFVGQAGALLNDVIPIAVAAIGLTANSAFSMKMMGYTFLVALVTIPITTAVSLIKAPQGVPMPAERPGLSGMLKTLQVNKPFWSYLACFITTGLGLGVVQLIFTFYDGYLKVGKYYPYMMVAFSITIALAIPLWAWMSRAIGKHRAYAVSMFLVCLVTNGFWFIHPGVQSQTTVVAFATLVVIVMGIGVSATLVLPPSILADVIDYGTWKTGVVRTGSYFAFYLLTTKIAMAVGAGLGFMSLAAFGYSAKAGAVNGPQANFGMMFTIVLIPTVLKVAGSLMLWNFPLDQRRHAIVSRRLEQRVARKMAAGNQV
jgi:GPH family glycoside/pentoside/hexuronide:cation symporter